MYVQVLSIPLLTSYTYVAMLSGFSLAFLINCASVMKNVLSVSGYPNHWSIYLGYIIHQQVCIKLFYILFIRIVVILFYFSWIVTSGVYNNWIVPSAKQSSGKYIFFCLFSTFPCFQLFQILYVPKFKLIGWFMV